MWNFNFSFERIFYAIYFLNSFLHSEGAILDDSLEYFDRYGVNDTRNVGFQNLNRSWFVSIDFGLYVAPKKKV